MDTKLLSKYGIIISTNEIGKRDIQRIDNVKEHKQILNFKFTPLQLDSDKQAKILYKMLVKNYKHFKK